VQNKNGVEMEKKITVKYVILMIQIKRNDGEIDVVQPVKLHIIREYVVQHNKQRTFTWILMKIGLHKQLHDYVINEKLQISINIQ
jgi:hypothetical protein